MLYSDEGTDTQGIIIARIEKILQAMSDDDPLMMLNETDFLFELLISKDENYVKKNTLLMDCYGNVQQLMLNEKTHRLLKLIQRVKGEPELAGEYYDTDRGNDPKLHYQEELETDLMLVSKEIRRCLALVAKDKLSGEIQL